MLRTERGGWRGVRGWVVREEGVEGVYVAVIPARADADHCQSRKGRGGGLRGHCPRMRRLQTPLLPPHLHVVAAVAGIVEEGEGGEAPSPRLTRHSAASR